MPASPRLLWSGFLATALFVGPMGQARAEGLLTVTSVPPGAAVTVDGKAMGVTPQSALALPAGRHWIVLTRRDQSSLSREVDLSDGQTLTVADTLPDLQGPPVAGPVAPPPSPTAPGPIGIAPAAAPATAGAAMPAAKPPWLGVPTPTWIAGGVAAALFGVGLGFGLSAANIDHRAGVTYSASGVDLGLTRATALAGERDATVANGVFIGAGVAALVGLAFAAFAPEVPSAAVPGTTAPTGAAP